MGKLFSAVLMVVIAYVIIYANQPVQASVSKRGSAKIPTPITSEGRHARGLLSKHHNKDKKYHEEHHGTCSILDILNYAFCEYSDKAYVEEMVPFIHKASRELAQTRHKLFREIPIAEYYQREELAETLDKAGDIFYRLSYNLGLPYDGGRDILSQMLDDGSYVGEENDAEYKEAIAATSKPSYTVSGASATPYSPVVTTSTASYNPVVTTSTASYNPVVTTSTASYNPAVTSTTSYSPVAATSTTSYGGAPSYLPAYSVGGVSGGIYNYQTTSYPGATYQMPKVAIPNYYAQSSNVGGYNYASPQSTGTYYTVGKEGYQPQYFG